jgi:DinB superfamily
MIENEDLRGTRYVDCQLDGAEFRETTLIGARFIGSVLIDVEIDALVRNLTVNGVDVVPLVEAELDRRHPERVALRPTDVAGVLAALDVVDDFWEPTLERLRGLPEEVGYTRVNDEWSTVETLRHLVSVYDGWFGRAVLGEADPYHPLGLTASFLDPADYGIDPDARPSLDEVLEARRARQQQVRDHVAALDDAELTATIPTHGVEGGFPPDQERSTLDCLTVIFDEEWAHHGFAVRDLAVLDPPVP